MSLIDAIIQRRREDVARILKNATHAQALVNEVDQYGFTPLIESAIVNDIQIADLLIQYGAEVNEQDLTGGTALHWAVENNNMPLCELLLEKGANPNLHTLYGKPPLVKPLLRQQAALKELLCHHKADLRFAQNYINTKLLGHRFELVGKVYIPNTSGKFIEVDYEGFVLEFTLNVIRDSFVSFKNHFVARNLRTYFPHMFRVIQSLVVAAELIRFQQYLTDRSEYADKIEILLQMNPLLIPVGYEGHAITFVKYGNYFAKCDRGENSLKGHSIVIYKMGRPEACNADFIQRLLYEKQNSLFINAGIFDWLALEPVTHLPIHSQISGNCSWANIEAAIPTLLFMMLFQDETDVRDVIHRKASVLSLHRQWANWDKNRALRQCLDGFYDGTDLGKISKAEILTSVLLQKCRDQLPRDMNRVHEILAILTQPQYNFALKAYLRVYAQQEKTTVGNNLIDLLDLCGYEVSDLI